MTLLAGTLSARLLVLAPSPASLVPSALTVIRSRGPPPSLAGVPPAAVPSPRNSVVPSKDDVSAGTQRSSRRSTVGTQRGCLGMVDSPLRVVGPPRRDRARSVPGETPAVLTIVTGM